MHYLGINNVTIKKKERMLTMSRDNLRMILKKSTIDRFKRSIRSCK